MDEDQAYRAMDLLVEADTDAEVQEAVFFAVADLLNLEVDLLFFDTTSTYFETEDPDEFRKFGKSKDSRPDLPQIVIGLAVTREGIPVRCWVWPGNTNDNSILPEVKDGLRGWRLGRVVTVVDRGFSSDANLDYLRRAGGHWIAGEKMRDGSADAHAVLARQGRYKSVRDNLRVKEVRLDTGNDDVRKRWIICHNPYEAERDAAKRTAAVERVAAELARIDTARTRDTKKKGGGDDRHAKAECALRDHPTLGRWVRQLKSGRLRIDTAKIRSEERLDGKYLLSTSDPDLSAEDVALGYKNLLEAERGFRDMKSTLDLRPVYHRIEPRIRGHVLLCWLALLLIRVAERRTGLTWRRIAIELGRIHTVTLTGTAGTVSQTTPLTAVQQSIVDACGVPAPPPVTHINPS
jgi:transposase